MGDLRVQAERTLGSQTRNGLGPQIVLGPAVSRTEAAVAGTGQSLLPGCHGRVGNLWGTQMVLTQTHPPVPLSLRQQHH